MRPSPPSWSWVIAKTDRYGHSRQRGGPLWNTLLAHAFDAAAVCGALFDDYLAVPARDRLAEAYGGGCAATARTVLMLLTALHDLGKATPGWQRLFLNTPARDHDLHTAATEWSTLPRQAGLLTDAGWDNERTAPHQHITARYLPALLGCPGCTPSTDSEHHDGLHAVAAALGGHHGHIPPTAAIKDADVNLDPTWQAVHEDLLHQLVRVLRLDPATLPGMIAPERPIALIHLCGLTVMSDWIASDETRFAYRAGGSPTQWWARSRTDAARAVRELCLHRWTPQGTDWPKLFPATPTPNALQQAVLDAAPTGPVLAFIESATGSGKTEAALWLAHHLALQQGYHGFYLAQATRMATEQLATRCADFLTHSLGDAALANLAIVHGTVGASPTARELQTRHRGLTQLADANLTDDDSSTCDSRTILNEWFLGVGRGLLSCFGIGTVDQVVLAAQKHRHWFLRLFGLAQKTVIIDEAHAYQMYQQRLLATAVTWLAEAGASVITLSATLPETIRRDLTDAWCTGHHTTARPATGDGPLTFVDAHGQPRHHQPTHTPRQYTDIHLHTDPGPRSLAQTLLDNDECGVAGVIRNRIAPATDLYRALRESAECHGWDPDQELVLLHSLFLERDRARIQQRLLTQLGPHPDPELRTTTPNPHRPKRLLLVGTQVLEQSLDIDLDLLYTDLAPIDLLLQRRGRLWRHLLNRPHLTDTDAPPLHILWQPDTTGLPHVQHPDGRPTSVYAPYIQAATWHALHRDTGTPWRLATPDDATALIHRIYCTAPPTGTSPLERLLTDTYNDWQSSLAQQEAAAEERAVPPYPAGEPCDIDDLASGPAYGDADDTEHPLHLIARSRLGTPSINAVGLYEQSDGTRSWDPKGQLLADLTRYHPYKEPEQHREQQSDILLNTLAIPHHWFYGKKPLPHHGAWTIQRPGALSRTPVLLFSPSGKCRTPGLEHLTYSPATGLSRR
ncbi:CRISPR-associated helicase Cas3' [Streptomyces chrestomyceticus]|uniref:CRISPR-associated helicase Cas3' n=1 Tax=Streptomyces chrestomyceticus TaxID=68185 RepID=UPI00379D4757